MYNTDYSRQRAYAKINLTLDVGGMRPDGFHEVTMVMQTVGLWDEITLNLRRDGKIHLDCNWPYLVRDERNIAWRAAHLILQTCGRSEGVDIRLAKKIPVAAGLAGGSSDAAAVLRGMNHLLKAGLSLRELSELAKQLGSDVPYCLTGGTCLATGRGEELERIETMPPAYVVLVKPDFGISTPWAYAHFDPERVQRRPDVDAMREAIRSQNLTGIGAEMVNLLETAALEAYPVLNTIKGLLRQRGAAGVLMSGSGPTVYGLFEKERQAYAAARVCRGFFPRSYQVFCCSLFRPKNFRDRV